MILEPEDFTIIPAPFWVALIAVLLFGCPSTASAEPAAQAISGSAKVTLHTEACQLKEVVNLPRRATWEESGKTFEGCWSASPIGVVVMYFSDKTVAVAPIDNFTRVQGA